MATPFASTPETPPPGAIGLDQSPAAFTPPPSFPRLPVCENCGPISCPAPVLKLGSCDGIGEPGPEGVTPGSLGLKIGDTIEPKLRLTPLESTPPFPSPKEPPVSPPLPKELPCPPATPPPKPPPPMLLGDPPPVSV